MSVLARVHNSGVVNIREIMYIDYDELINSGETAKWSLGLEDEGFISPKES